MLKIVARLLKKATVSDGLLPKDILNHYSIYLNTAISRCMVQILRRTKSVFAYGWEFLDIKYQYRILLWIFSLNKCLSGMCLDCNTIASFAVYVCSLSAVDLDGCGVFLFIW